MPRFDANLSMMFREHAFLDRFVAAAKAGFEAVECWYPYEWAATELVDRLRHNGLQQTLFNLPPGNLASGERGLACLPGRQTDFRASVELAIEYAEALDCPRMHCMAGVKADGVAAAELEAIYVENVSHAAARCEEFGIELLIEPINPVDIPGYLLDDFARALRLIESIEQRGGYTPRMLFDIYHCARIHGDVPEWIARCAPHIAHFQIAGVPGRHEPNVGDLPLHDILEAVDRYCPDCWIGCEYHPAGATVDGLSWMRRD